MFHGHYESDAQNIQNLSGLAGNNDMTLDASGAGRSHSDSVERLASSAEAAQTTTPSCRDGVCVLNWKPVRKAEAV